MLQFGTHNATFRTLHRYKTNHSRRFWSMNNVINFIYQQPLRWNRFLDKKNSKSLNLFYMYRFSGESSGSRSKFTFVSQVKDFSSVTCTHSKKNFGVLSWLMKNNPLIRFFVHMLYSWIDGKFIIMHNKRRL